MALPTRSLLLGVTAALLSAALGATLGAYIVAPPVPESLTHPDDITSASVTARPYTDERSVRVKVQLKEAVPVTAPVTGRVTALRVAPHASLASGSKIMDVDGLPVVALHTTTPLYREIADGVAGDDITALQEELQRLGYDISTTGKVNWATRSAAADLLGVDDGQGGVPEALPHTHFLWLPTVNVTVNEVKVSLGDTLTEQSTILTLTGGANTGMIDIPADALPGARVLFLQDKEYPVADNGVVDNPELLEQILRIAAQQNMFGPQEDAKQTNEVSVTAPWRLAKPLEVQVVPASALIEARDNHACVSADGKTIPVTIIASELGQTFVQSDTPVHEVSLKTEGLTCQ